jgi:hypothetical protein
MKNSSITRRGAFALMGALLVSACTIDAPPPGGGIVPPPPGGGPPPPPPPPPPSNIAINTGEFKGFDGSGTRQRVRIRNAGRNYTLQTLTGQNGPQVLYVDQGDNVYRASSGYTIRVTSPRSFTWSGQFGTISMVD